MSKKAQAISEYVVILSLIVGAVVAVGVYLRRGIQQTHRLATHSVVRNICQTKYGDTQIAPNYYQYYPEQRSKYTTRRTAPQTSEAEYHRGEAHYRSEEHYNTTGYTQTADINGDYY